MSRRTFFLIVPHIVLAVILFWRTPSISALPAADLTQARLNQALPPLREGVTIEQPFTPRHNGLSSVQVQIARYEPATDEGMVNFTLLDARGESVGGQLFRSDELVHNQHVTLQLYAQPDSRGQVYTLRVTAEGDTPISLWGYTLATFGEENALTVTGAESKARILTFSTQYDLLPADALVYLGERAAQEGALWLLALALMAMPGALLLTLMAERVSILRRMDSGAWWGLAIALGIALWALGWMWLSLAGGRWNAPVLWGILVAGWVVTFALWWRQGRRWTLPTRDSLALPLLLLVGFAARLLAIRDITIPPWVDSIRHALIATLMAEQGRVLSDYAPLLPVERFPYHFGFHTLPASLMLMTGWQVDALLLTLGQLLNALAPLAVYSGAWLLTRRRAVALGAAFLVALPFLFPGYYATWGRYTQLTGMLILPPLAGLLVRLISGARGWRGAWWLVALLGAGLFLAHIRVLLYLLPLPVAAWLLYKGRNTRALLAAGVMGGLLVLPRALYLLPRQASPAVFLNNIPDYNTFPTGYYAAGWETFFAIAALAAALIVILRYGRRHAWTLALLPPVLWVGLLFSTLAGGRLGLPESWLVNLNSMVITLFFPQSVLLAAVAAVLWRAFVRRLPPPPAGELAAYLPLSVGVMVLLLFGFRFQSGILNPDTILAQPADSAALAWVRENTPADATFAVNSWQWLGNTWAGSDGGAWLLPVARRQSSTPPADYEYSPDLTHRVVEFNAQLQTITDWRDPAAIAWLKGEGVTHIFVGARGGIFDPAALIENPNVTLLYAEEGAFVFGLR